ncbi:variable surface lipoprotein [Mycoplasmopsis agalactiae]|uniref:variable surface lipoprotein n=1 Tax=Mycoplasmopsis agalactiae TaxID=2110 RepID=UPI001F19B6EC|nr:variable surface lipoprotein [Mycoplasmopsis agalactiae]MCE6115278.1 variable surface lipoprotein [Mycoplasmopsis agalactiae]
MKKSKFLILGSVASFIAVPFVAAKCDSEAKNNAKEEKSSKSVNVGSKKQNEADNDMAMSMSSPDRSNDNSTLEKENANKDLNKSMSKSENLKSEKGILTESPSKNEMNNGSVNADRVANDTDASGYDIGRVYSSIDDGESVSDILDDEAKKDYKKEIEAEYENIKKLIETVLKDSSNKNEVLKQLEELKKLLNSEFHNAKTFKDLDKIISYLEKIGEKGKVK